MKMKHHVTSRFVEEGRGRNASKETKREQSERQKD